MKIDHDVKGVLFDLDGTLLDSKKSVIEAVFFASETFAPGKFTYKDIENRFGESFEEFIELLGTNNKTEIVDVYMDHIQKHHDKLVSLFKGVKEALEALKAQGMKLAVVTNKQRHLTIRGLDLFEITPYFDSIMTLDDVTEGKPSPEILLKAIDALGCAKEEVLMVGDTEFDVKAARAADVKVAVLDWYQTYSEHLPIPDYIFSTIHEKMTHFGWHTQKERMNRG